MRTEVQPIAAAGEDTPPTIQCVWRMERSQLTRKSRAVFSADRGHAVLSQVTCCLCLPHSQSHGIHAPPLG